MSEAPGIRLCEAVWEDRSEPYYAVEKSVYRTSPVTRAQADERIRSGFSFFCPVPYIMKGNKKGDCTKAFNVIWCDVDYDASWTIEAMVSRCQESLDPYNLHPSAMVFSGRRGLHVYFKLDTDVPVSTIESLNQRLISCVGGDRRTFDCVRLLRVPGTINAKSGRRAELLELSGHIYNPTVFEALPEPQRRGESTFGATTTSALARDAPWRLAAESLHGWTELELRSLNDLPDQCQVYMRDRPRAPWGRWGYPSRSEMEAAIVSLLIGKGWGASDRQIKDIADEWFAKHREMPDGKYLERTIASARAHLFESGWISSPLGGYPRKRDARYRHSRTTGVETASLSLVRGQTVVEWVHEIQTLGVSRSTAYRIKMTLVSSGIVIVRDGRIVPSIGDALGSDEPART